MLRLAKNKAAASEISAALNSADTDLDGLVDINELCNVLKTHRKDLVCRRSGFRSARPASPQSRFVRRKSVLRVCSHTYCICRRR